MNKMKKILIYFSWLVLIALLSVASLLGASAWQIYDYAHTPDKLPNQLDAAVVLGAAAWGNKPSPVFRERIQHGITLYQNKQVQQLIFTGGTPNLRYATEAQVARDFAVKQGVPSHAILLEETSRDTYQNLFNTRALMRQKGIHQIVIVSDPYHLARAMIIAKHLNINAFYSATPSSRYHNSSQSDDFFMREMLYVSLFRIFQFTEWLRLAIESK